MFSTKFYAATEEYSTLELRIPAPYLRRTLTLEEAPTAAKLTVCGLGFYDLSVNGQRITKGLLAPYISNPDDLLYYDSYDLTDRLTAGENVLGFVLGNGMLNCPGGQVWDFETAAYRSAPKLAFALELTLADGTQQLIEADEALLTHPSPIIYDDLRVGEFYDARLELAGWDAPGFDASDWTPAIPAVTPKGTPRITDVEPILPQRELAPVSIRQAKIGKQPTVRPNLPIIPYGEGEDGTAGGYLYDFGVNAAGLCRLTVKGKPGQKIVLQFGEELDENGDLDMRGMSFLPLPLNHREVYYCNGRGTEVYLPRFTYHGFRYCLVLGITEEQATEELLTYVVMNSDLREIGGFSCSNELLNRLQSAVHVADLANFYYFPTDCPHREKNGWTADAALSSEHMLQTLQAERSLAEWMLNIRHAQREDGALPGIIPTAGWGFKWGNGPAWDSVITTIPYMVWKYTGNTDILRDNADAMLRYIAYIKTRRDERGLLHIGLGDWCQVNRLAGHPQAPLELTDTLMTLEIATRAAKMLNVIGRSSDAAIAAELAEELLVTARKHLIDPATCTALGDCQTSQALCIWHNVFTEEQKPRAFAKLVEMIEADGEHMNVGVLGARIIFHLLSQFGRTDLAYRMIVNPTFPSYGHLILERNATALFEDFLPNEMGVGSRNHHFWGDVSSWMLQNLAGLRINPTETDPNHAVIHPHFLPELSQAEGWHECPAGEVAVSWMREGDAILLTVTAAEGLHGSISVDPDYTLPGSCFELPLKSGCYRIEKR